MLQVFFLTRREEGRNGWTASLRLVKSCILLILILFPAIFFAQTEVSPGRFPILRTQSDVFKLTKAEAAQGRPIAIEAVVTYSDPEWGILFVQDQSGPTFIDVHGIATKFPTGIRVHVQAVTGTNQDGAIFAHPKITIDGRGVMPAPKQESIVELQGAGDESYQTITEGILRPCEAMSARVCFRIYDGQKFAWLAVPQADSPQAQSLVGAVVRVKGVVGRHVNDANQRLGTQLYVNTLADIKVLAPAATDLLSSQPLSIQQVHGADADQRFAPQIHLRGTVIWHSPGLFALRDPTGMIFVSTWSDDVAHPGSTLDVVGFPSHGIFALEVADASIRPFGPAGVNAVPTPLDLNAPEILKRGLSGIRVHLKARLVGQTSNASEFVYLLDSNGQRFNAILLRTDAKREMVGLTRDSILELTGVTLVQRDNPVLPESLLLLLESPADVDVHPGLGWLTVRWMLVILAAILVCVLTPLIWVRQLRSTVRKQTGALRAQFAHELQLENRFRRLFERNLAAVYSWKPDGEIVECNDAFVKLLGFETRNEVLGRSYWEFETDPEWRAQFSSTLAQEACSNRETTLRRIDGATLHLLANVTPVQGEGELVYETTAIDITQLRLHQDELQRTRDAAVYESLNDSLTGLPNRRCVLDTLSTHLAQAREDGSRIALLYLDLDGFKIVNDSLGHSIGDALLTFVALRLRADIREGDMLARLGGDEFMIIMNRIDVHEQADAVAEHVLSAISKPFHVKGHSLSIGVSIGISYFPGNAADAEELMQQADSAMYAAKRAGKNNFMHFNPAISSLIHERMTLENLLRGAVARHEITLHYQPEFDLHNQRLIRFEALARWTHPTIGSIPPDKFIPIAEESGIIGQLGAYIMEQACLEAMRWQGLVPEPVQVAVNVSTIQFRHRGFVEEVNSILKLTGLKPELLQIELTESVMMDGAESAIVNIQRLKELGISLAIDDFGTGYSNLSYLPSMAFDVIKIDRAFVTNIESQPETESMVRTLITLANNIGMRVIVEGVEKHEQLAILRDCGANEVQGFFMGRPTPRPIDDFLTYEGEEEWHS
jgi:diguanylate cyclase (GGDEF)-like protein/PAS domain S-box-containing protein